MECVVRLNSASCSAISRRRSNSRRLIKPGQRIVRGLIGNLHLLLLFLLGRLANDVAEELELVNALVVRHAVGLDGGNDGTHRSSV